MTTRTRYRTKWHSRFPWSSSSCKHPLWAREAIVCQEFRRPDYEASWLLSCKGGFRIPASAWRDHVYGYTIVNDVSGATSNDHSQWSMARAFHFLSLGAIVTADEIADLMNSPSASALTRGAAELEHRELLFKIRPDRVSSSIARAAGRHCLHRKPSGVGMGARQALAQTW